MEKIKPLKMNNYGTIALLPNSRVTPADHHCHAGQARIATQKARDRHDEVIIQEKLDGSNVGAARLNDEILAITRAGYLAITSPYEQHWHWATWVKANESRFRYVLNEGERICGEWLMQAHGTRYNLWHEPFVAFDIMLEHYRLPYDPFLERTSRGHFVTPHLIHRGQPLNVDAVLARLGYYGYHGAIDEVEGAVFRVQRKGEIDFLVKYLKPYKKDGAYLPGVTGGEPVWNWYYKAPERKGIEGKTEDERVLFTTG